MVSLLLNYGADITLCNSKGQSVLDFAPDSMRPLLLGMLNSLKHLFGWRWLGRGLDSGQKVVNVHSQLVCKESRVG